MCGTRHDGFVRGWCIRYWRTTDEAIAGDGDGDDDDDDAGTVVIRTRIRTRTRRYVRYCIGT